MQRPRVLLAVAAVAAVLVVVAAAVYLPSYLERGTPVSGRPCGVAGGPSLSVSDLTATLPASFAHGSIQAFGSNSTAVVFGGVSYYDRGHLPYDSEPALSSYTPATSSTEDLTNETSTSFGGGGVFPVGWNGSAWLMAGQSTIGNVTEGSAASWESGRFTDLTPVVGPYFEDQGIWIAGWDGHGWLLGGNNTQGAVLVYLQGDTVTNLTSLLPDNVPTRWIQALAWNGTGWLVGGQGIFGSFEDGRYTNLLPASPFASGAALAMDWNGTAWLVGGSPTGLAYVRGGVVSAAPALAVGGDGWVNSVVAVPGKAWIVSGGSFAAGRYAPFLASVPMAAGPVVPVDESACLPSGFADGWVQYGAWAPAFGTGAILLVGEGGTDPQTFESHAAAAVLSVGT